jgi:hypothetical protein
MYYLARLQRLPYLGFIMVALLWGFALVPTVSAFQCAAPPPAVPVCTPAVVPLAPVCQPSPLFPPAPPLVAPVIVCPEPVVCGPIIVPEVPPLPAWTVPYRRRGVVRAPLQSADAGVAPPVRYPPRGIRPMSQ